MPALTLASAGTPTAQVIPAKVAIQGKATLTARHLRPGITVTLLFAVPDLSMRKTERLLGATHADARGNIRIAVAMPLVTTCGPASIYLISAQTQQRLRARFTLTGCVASKKDSAPPPPPRAPHKP